METQIRTTLLNNATELLGTTIKLEDIVFQRPHKHVQADITLLAFPFSKILKCSPTVAGEKIGNFLQEKIQEITNFNIIGGFINIIVADKYWSNELHNIFLTENFGIVTPNTQPLIMVEYSSPNTNKPLHLGHLRNIFVGDAVANILHAVGHKVVRTQIINDRGIHICKSMIAWLEFAPKDENGERETPESTNTKGDKFVGKYYVEFDKHFQQETKKNIENWEKDEFDNLPSKVQEQIRALKLSRDGKDEKNIQVINEKLKELAKNYTPLFLKAKKMLQKWEANDREVVELWKKMNSWVYDGFEQTYKKINVTFDRLYYESDTFHMGKKIVADGLKQNVFFQKDDGSVWIDLTPDGLDEKLVLRSDGTAVYMTQDIGTALQRFSDYPDLNGIVYTVGNEQDYHFKVLFLILQKLGYKWANNCFHLSYGMVDLPEGKMKSREGTVVDADDLMAEVIEKATQTTIQRGHIEGLPKEEIEQLCQTIGIGGLKYFLLKIDPKKRMVFNPAESVELNGNTAPFIQYAYARIQTLLAKSGEKIKPTQVEQMLEIEKDIIKTISIFPQKIAEAAKNYSPALIANYTYDLVKLYNQFYQTVSILKEEDITKRIFRLTLSKTTGTVIKTAMNLLGINVPNKM